MNRYLLVVISLAVFVILSSTLLVFPSKESDIEPVNESYEQINHNRTYHADNHSSDTHDGSVVTDSPANPGSHDHGEKNFDFTPYVHKEMVEEVARYTSRDKDGLEIEVNNDGTEVVDLKRRWSHATISVLDEKGEKHTGEWAPK